MELLTYKDRYQEYTYYLDKNGEEVNHGEHKSWLDNGQLWALSYWCHGKCHGEFKRWNIHGKLRNHVFYINHKEHPYVEMNEQEKLFFQIQHPGFRFIEE